MTTDVAVHLRDLANEILQDTVFSLEGPVSKVGLSLVPIVARDEAATADEYLNAAEAFEQRVLSITEAGDAVNTIIAQNSGSIPILIEESEVLKSDRTQDRIVVVSVLLQPGTTQRIPVKCVHAPHSLNRGAGFYSVGAGTADIRSSMRKRKYMSIMTDVEHYVPESVVDQGEVWDKVERYCKSIGIGDPTKYTDAIAKLQDEAGRMAKEIRGELPEETCGVIAIDASGKVVALELYRRPKAFWKRAGFVESLLLEYSNAEAKPLEKETAWSKALQLLFHLRALKSEEVASQEDSDNVTVGLGDLRGEAILGAKGQGEEKRVLYCSLGM